uniref:Uncharacterized protein n=1 Tax=Arundo donax TaxID=35708 RepID=A0A0A8YLG4_ARUDO
MHCNSWGSAFKVSWVARSGLLDG